ncbi:Hypothetical_protein [Hexamita inflata]|uniref:Hypothetical_protein n=1 Tax=Hexamita inflata TaxID=28002 RepID=A0AA86TYX5_9EUKA|nr:Hypothetical protein HINF_LOCUS19982 [Hexamita inflata]
MNEFESKILFIDIVGIIKTFIEYNKQNKVQLTPLINEDTLLFNGTDKQIMFKLNADQIIEEPFIPNQSFFKQIIKMFNKQFVNQQVVRTLVDLSDGTLQFNDLLVKAEFQWLQTAIKLKE